MGEGKEYLDDCRGNDYFKEEVMKIIIGQEAICDDGLGRVMWYDIKAPNNWVQISTYFNDRQCKWDIDNVELINPRGKDECIC